MAGQGSGASVADGGQVNSLLQINDMDYRIPPALSVVNKRSHGRYPAGHPITNQGQTLQFTFASGAQYINARNSYLAFDVELTGAPGAPARTYYLGSKPDGNVGAVGASCPGALALFSGFRYIHSGGQVLDELVTDLDLISYQNAMHSKDENWRKSVGSLFGGLHPDNSLSFVSAAGNTFVPPRQRVIVPLCLISDIFDQDQLSPSFLMSGSRLDLQLNTFAQAFQADQDDPNVRFVITGAEVYLEQYQLTEAVGKTLASISATSGLEIPFISTHINPVTASVNQQSIQVTRALSRVNNVALMIRESVKLNNLTADGIGTRNVPEDVRFQVQLGGQYIPIMEVLGQRETLQMSLVTQNDYMRGLTAGVRLRDFTGKPTTLARTIQSASLGRYAITLESSSSLAQSGSALSAQRVLIFNIYGLGDTEQSRFVLAARHVTLATIFLDSVVVRS